MYSGHTIITPVAALLCQNYWSAVKC